MLSGVVLLSLGSLGEVNNLCTYLTKLSAVHAPLGRPTTFPKGSKARTLHLGTESLLVVMFVFGLVFNQLGPHWSPISCVLPRSR